MTRDVLVSVVGVLAGGGLLVRAVWDRRGASTPAREWSFGGAKAVTNAMLLRPGAGLALLAIAVLPWLDVGGLVVPFVVLLVPGLAVLLAGMLLPRVPLRLLPAWAREPVGSRRRAS